MRTLILIALSAFGLSPFTYGNIKFAWAYDEDYIPNERGVLVFSAGGRSNPGVLFNGFAEAVDTKILRQCTSYRIVADFGQGWVPVRYDRAAAMGNFNVYFSASRSVGEARYIAFSCAELRDALLAAKPEFVAALVSFEVLSLDRHGDRVIIAADGKPEVASTCPIRIVNKRGRLFLNGVSGSGLGDENAENDFVEWPEREITPRGAARTGTSGAQK